MSENCDLNIYYDNIHQCLLLVPNIYIYKEADFLVCPFNNVPITWGVTCCGLSSVIITDPFSALITYCICRSSVNTGSLVSCSMTTCLKLSLFCECFEDNFGVFRALRVQTCSFWFVESADVEAHNSSFFVSFECIF